MKREVTRPEAIGAIRRGLEYCGTFETDIKRRRESLRKMMAPFGVDQEQKERQLDDFIAQENDFKILRSLLEASLLFVEKRLTYRERN